MNIFIKYFINYLRFGKIDYIKKYDNTKFIYLDKYFIYNEEIIGLYKYLISVLTNTELELLSDKFMKSNFAKLGGDNKHINKSNFRLLSNSILFYISKKYKEKT